MTLRPLFDLNFLIRPHYVFELRVVTVSSVLLLFDSNIFRRVQCLDGCLERIKQNF